MIALCQSVFAEWQMDWAYPEQNDKTGGATVQVSGHAICHDEVAEFDYKAATHGHPRCMNLLAVCVPLQYVPESSADFG